MIDLVTDIIEKVLRPIIDNESELSPAAIEKIHQLSTCLKILNEVYGGAAK